MKETEIMETMIDYDHKTTVPLQAPIKRPPDDIVQAPPLNDDDDGQFVNYSNQGNPYLKIFGWMIVGVVFVTGPLYILGKSLPGKSPGTPPPSPARWRNP